MRLREEILADIDTTLDQLIQNAEVAHDVCTQPLFEDEVKALQKTQESLLARLINMSDLLDVDADKNKKKLPSAPKPIQGQIQNKIIRFGQLNEKLINNVAETFGVAKKKPVKKARVHKRKRQFVKV